MQFSLSKNTHVDDFAGVIHFLPKIAEVALGWSCKAFCTGICQNDFVTRTRIRQSLIDHRSLRTDFVIEPVKRLIEQIPDSTDEFLNIAVTRLPLAVVNPLRLDDVQ